MSRPGAALPVFLQVGLLVVLSIAAAMGIAFGVIVHAPPPAPAGFTLDQAAEALGGQEVRTAEGRILRRTLSQAPPVNEDASNDPLARVIAVALADRLDRPVTDVRVLLRTNDAQSRRRIHDDLGAAWTRHEGGRILIGERRQTDTVVIRRRPSGGDASPPPEPPPPPPAPPDPTTAIITEEIHGMPAGGVGQRITILTEDLRFPPFTASVRMADGDWATVRPPAGLLSPWHTRILLTFLASLLVLTPLAWWIARRLTRPIRMFAEAAERLGADPHAPPLSETGPAEVRNAAAAFNDMQDKLNRYVAGRTQMVAAIAHDLRTPLTRLRFRAEQADPAIRDRMAADIDQMDGMISQALSYVRGETVREERVTLDFGALAASVVHDLNEIGAAVSVETASGLMVSGESLNLRRAIGNLVENAVKFTGGARVLVEAVDGRAVVRVLDDGPGLPEPELEAAFEPFRRAEPSRNRQTGGSGLGLAVARGVARAHGGDVALSNRPEGGLEARLTVPLI